MTDWRDNWNGRPVKIVDFNMLEGDEVLDLIWADKRREATYLMLVYGLRYADTGEPVFTSMDDLRRQTPNRLRERVAYLSGKAAFLNGFRSDDPDVKPEVKPNGHDESAAVDGPSP